MFARALALALGPRVRVAHALAAQRAPAQRALALALGTRARLGAATGADAIAGVATSIFWSLQEWAIHERLLHSKKPWRAVLARRRWRGGYNAGGGPNHMGQLGRCLCTAQQVVWTGYQSLYSGLVTR